MSSEASGTNADSTSGRFSGVNQAETYQSSYYGNYGHNNLGVQFASCESYHHSSDIHPICSLLMREAEAWRAVLGLHGNVIASTQQIARCPDHNETASVEYDERKLNSESREAAYCSALSGLASQCDSLFAEVLRLRNLRKARRSVEVECVNVVVRSHADEVLAIGQTLASNGSLNVASATAEMRAAVQGQRNQVSQLRSFMEALREGVSLPLPKGSKLVIGVQESEGEVRVRSLDEVLASVYQDDRDVTEAGLSRILASMFLGAETASPDLKFVRRDATR